MSQPDDVSDVSPQEDAGETLPLIELETLLSQPPSWRKRFRQLGLLLAALAVVLAAYWGINRPAASSAPVVAQPNAPPPTVRVVSNVNYGALTINGQPQRGGPPLTFRARSQPPYTITLDAPPFPPLTCQYPPVKTIAPYVFHPCNAGGVLTVDQQASNVLEMLFTLNDLPAAQQQQIGALIADDITAQQTLTAPAQSVIVAGLNQDGTPRTRLAAGTLSASVFLVAGAQLLRRGLFCASVLCVGSGGYSADAAASAQVWQVLTPIALRWRFTTASGQVVSDVTFPAFSTLLILDLTYQPATGWRLASPPNLSEQLSQLVCATGVQALTLAQTNALGGDGWVVSVLRDQGAAGCELELAQNAVDQGHFVWRFGALLAADAQAHRTLPALPVASAQELAAVGG